jgi:hypothetical protein
MKLTGLFVAAGLLTFSYAIPAKSERYTANRTSICYHIKGSKVVLHDVCHITEKGDNEGDTDSLITLRWSDGVTTKIQWLVASPSAPLMDGYISRPYTRNANTLLRIPPGLEVPSRLVLTCVETVEFNSSVCYK